jgi:hypothetical protein
MAIRSTVFTLLLVSLPGLIEPAAACGCFDNPPCAAVWKADAVFVGTVTDRRLERIAGNLSWMVDDVAVSQRLRGAIDSSITLVSSSQPSAEQRAAAQGPAEPTALTSTCDYDFEVGKQYVIYARRTADGRWTTSKCAGTKPLEDAASDLDYIATIPLLQPTGRVYGSIERAVLDPENPDATMAVPAAGVRVVLRSDRGRLVVATDADGRIDVQVPPGDYTMAPDVPGSVRVFVTSTRISVPARGCSPVSFTLISNGRIRGRVVRSDGRPAPGISVTAIPVHAQAGQRLDHATIAPTSISDANGRYLIDAVLPGRYVVGVNARFGPRLSEPYAITYAPGVARPAARVLDMGDGQQRRGVDIEITPLRETILSGRIEFDDGRPAPDASVTAWHADHPGIVTTSAKADRDGVFRLRVLKGQRYRLTASIQTPQGNHAGEVVVEAGDAREEILVTIQP